MNLPGNDPLKAIPDLIYPHLGWGESDYARLQVRLDIYDDVIVLKKFAHGEVVGQHIVNPTEVAAALAGLDLSSGLLPRDVLFWSKRGGEDRLAIYIPSNVWLVTVRGETLAWRVPLPGLILIGHGYDYSLWAVTERPTDTDTPLYMAPCPNVHPEGVCRGSAPFPKAGPTTIWQGWDSFISSKFNRDLSNHKSRAYPECVLDQWRALHQAGVETYPLDDLVATRLTLGGLIHGRA
jgi:hypothetical protein